MQQVKVNNNGRWLFSKTQDLLVLFIPVWLCWIILGSLPSHILSQEIPLWVWVVFVLGIDVGHVWSTIFRTYLNKEEFANNKRILTLAPLVSLVALLAFALLSQKLFWTMLAYFAVFHFMKQQYGFLALYRAKNKDFNNEKLISDKFIIYFSMLYPVLYWHLDSSRNFSWFTDGDFINIEKFISGQLVEQIFLITNWVYWAVMILWGTQEFRFVKKQKRPLNFGVLFWVYTTALNWYLGIVYFNSDLVFTITNVVAHGVPYIGLIVFYNKRKKEIVSRVGLKTKQVMRTVMSVIVSVIFLAFVEEYFWDMLLYHDNPEFFQSIIAYPFNILNKPWLQAIALAFLSLPQVTHYVIDGFIWKNNKHNPYLKKVFS